MRFPVDTSRLKCLVVAAAAELHQFEEGKPRAAWVSRKDADGKVPGLRLGEGVLGEFEDGRLACGA
jgi:hypothetical protein